MIEKIIDVKYLSVDEKKLLSLLYSCPLEEPCETCIFSHMRKFLKWNNLLTIDSFDKDKIQELFSLHLKCLFNRVRYANIKPNSKINCKFSNGIAYLKWTSKVDKGFLTTELKKRNWIKSQYEFAKLFDNADLNLKVHWNMQFKYELAFLLFKLKEADFIRPVNSKGYFSIAENHIVDYFEKPLTNNSLKKINSKISTNPDTCIDKVDKVKEVIKAITPNSKGLFKDYS